jgi:transcriptional regulator with XRE-family HTH domain
MPHHPYHAVRLACSSNIVKRRVALGLRQSDLAARTRLSKNTIARIEAASHPVALRTLARVADALNTDPVSLLRHEITDAIL